MVKQAEKNTQKTNNKMKISRIEIKPKTHTHIYTQQENEGKTMKFVPHLFDKPFGKCYEFLSCQIEYRKQII